MGSAAGSSPALYHGNVQKGTLSSAIWGSDRSFLIYLPPGYDGTQQSFPVLYLLHGAPGGPGDWLRGGGIDQTLDALISVGRIPPIIAVLADGNGGLSGDTEWANSADRSIRVEDHLLHEVVPFIDKHFRTRADRDHRAVGGYSTGGFGAANLALHHPELFGYVLSMSGNFLAAPTWTGQDMWAGDPLAKRFNSPILYAPQVPNVQTLHLYLAVGTSDTTNDTYHQTQQFDLVLDCLRVPHHTDYDPGGHSWGFWRAHFVAGLDYLATVMPA
ncbi:MAG: alpha/beta hydrolase-fold protein [Herpetosiphon sp.]